MKTNRIEVYSDDLVLRVTHESGDSLELDRETGRVTLSGSVEYSVFVKLFKELKRAINRASFYVENFED